MLGHDDREGPESDTVPDFREFTFITVPLLGSSQIFREFSCTALHVILVTTGEELKQGLSRGSEGLQCLPQFSSWK